MRHVSKVEAALFMSFDDGLKAAFHSGLTYDQAIQKMREKIELLERCRDNGLDPTAY